MKLYSDWYRPNLSDGIVAGPNNGDVVEGGCDPDGPCRVLHHQAVDKQRLYSRHTEVWQTLRQVWPKVVEGVLDTVVQLRIALAAW